MTRYLTRKEKLLSDLLFIRDNAVISLDSSKVYTVDEVTDLLDRTIDGLFKAIQNELNDDSPLSEVIEQYFEQINQPTQ